MSEWYANTSNLAFISLDSSRVKNKAESDMKARKCDIAQAHRDQRDVGKQVAEEAKFPLPQSSLETFTFRKAEDNYRARL